MPIALIAVVVAALAGMAAGNTGHAPEVSHVSPIAVRTFTATAVLESTRTIVVACAPDTCGKDPETGK